MGFMEPRQSTRGSSKGAEQGHKSLLVPTMLCLSVSCVLPLKTLKDGYTYWFSIKDSRPYSWRGWRQIIGIKGIQGMVFWRYFLSSISIIHLAYDYCLFTIPVSPQILVWELSCFTSGVKHQGYLLDCVTGYFLKIYNLRRKAWSFWRYTQIVTLYQEQIKGSWSTSFSQLSFITVENMTFKSYKLKNEIF